MSIRFVLASLVFCLASSAQGARAQETGTVQDPATAQPPTPPVELRVGDNPPAAAPVATPATSDNPMTFGDILNFDKSLRISPKTVSSTDGQDSTVGVEYEYKRLFKDISQGGDIDLYFESKGFLAADKDVSIDRQLEHKLRLQVINIGKNSRDGDYEAYRVPGQDSTLRAFKEKHRIYKDPRLREARDYYNQFQRANEPEKTALFEKARALWGIVLGENLTRTDDGFWPEMDRYEREQIEGDPAFTSFKQGVSLPWVSFELNGGAESDQDFSNAQYVGGARLYGKWQALGTPVDLLCKAVRGYEEVHSFLNFQGGPYLWAGVDVVDATENEARNAITGGNDDVFPRFSAGAYYRNELMELPSASEYGVPVSLEVGWDFYAEIDAPASIRAANRDTTSFFRATLLFGDHLFAEYTDGRKPLDIASNSAIAAGFRFGL